MSGKPQVIVTASPTGSVTVETAGVVGPACGKLSAAIEAALGAKTADVKKPEYDQHAPVAQQQGQQASQGAG